MTVKKRKNNVNNDKGKEKRGPKGKKGYTIKYQRGHHYVYTWFFDIERTNERKEELEQLILEGEVSELKDENLWNKASRYEWLNIGALNYEIIEVTEDGYYKIELLEPEKEELKVWLEKNWKKAKMVEEDLEKRLNDLAFNPDYYIRKKTGKTLPLPILLKERLAQKNIPLPR